MMKAEKQAMESYKKDLIKQVIDKEIAAVMAKAFVEAKIVKPVVY